MLPSLEERLLREAESIFCLLHPLHLQGVELAQLQVTLPSAQVTGCRLHSLITAAFFSYRINPSAGSVQVSTVERSTLGPAVWFPALILLLLDVELRTGVPQARGTRV